MCVCALCHRMRINQVEAWQRLPSLLLVWWLHQLYWVVAIMVQRRGYQCRCPDCNHTDGIFISLPCKGIHLSARGINKLHRIPSSVLDNKYGCVCLGLPPNNNECDARIYIQIF